jgi:hypothetical protein
MLAIEHNIYWCSRRKEKKRNARIEIPAWKWARWSSVDHGVPWCNIRFYASFRRWALGLFIDVAQKHVASNSNIGVPNKCAWYALIALNVNGHLEPQHCTCFMSTSKTHVGNYIYATSLFTLAGDVKWQSYLGGIQQNSLKTLCVMDVRHCHSCFEWVDIQVWAPF